LVELAVACRPRTVVDVGTGSGAIAVSVAVLCPEAVVYATDISPDALAYARANAAFHAVEARVRFFPGDLLAPLAGQGLEGAVDVVVSNPPYIARSQWESLPREVREYEPRVSLDGGEDGLDVYRRLAIPALPYLSPGGRLLLECGEGQAEGVRGILEQAGWQVEGIHRDLAGIQRAIQARRR
jgi:release factor glutamine methyltransferase